MREISNSNKKLFSILFLVILVVGFAGFFVYFDNSGTTGRLSFELNVIYNLGEPIDGDLNLRIKEGELVPKDSKVIVTLGEQRKEFLLSDVVLDAPVNGKFYAESSSLTGEGEGFGVEGAKVIYPEIDFDFFVGNKEAVSDAVSEIEEEIKETEKEEENGERGESGNETEAENNETDSGNSEEVVEEVNGGVSESESETETTEEKDKEDKEAEKEDKKEEKAEEKSDSESGSGDSGLTGEVIGETLYTSSGKVSKDNDFTYTIEEGQDAEIVPGSVKVSGTEIEDKSVKLKVNGNEVTVSTEYFVNERGFGEEFLGDYGMTLHFDLSDFDFVAVPGDLKVELVYGETEIASLNQVIDVNLVNGTLNVSSNETIANETLPVSSVVLISDIPTIRIPFGETYNLDLEQHFTGAESYELSNVSNIVSTFNGNILTLIPDVDFKGSRRAIVTGINGSDRVDSNVFLILVSSGAINVNRSHSEIRVGEPVKWTEQIQLDTPENVTIQLPPTAENVSVQIVTPQGSEPVAAEVNALSPLTGNVVIEVSLDKEPVLRRLIRQFFSKFGLTGRAIDVSVGEPVTEVVEESQGTIEVAVPTEEVPVSEQGVEVVLDDGAEEYVVEYYTEAPQATEVETPAGKEVVVSAPDDLGYTDVIAFSTIDELYPVGQENAIQIYWKENQEYVSFDAYDLDENGMIDYLEWNVPHLSNQTFIIILITNAQHLDSNRTVISDIYSSVNALDGNWSETIPSGDYVRVTFERNLTSVNDITIYPRTVSGTPRIDVYEIDGNETIASFSSLVDNQLNKVFLTGLIGEQDTFDLNILDGSVEFDYIVDPILETNQPSVSFVDPTPLNGSTLSGSAVFVNVSSADDSGFHYTFTDFNRDLVLWLRMDERNSTGGFIDLSSYNHIGSNVTTLASNDTSSVFGNSTTFYPGGVGAAQRINVGTPSTLNNIWNNTGMTVSAWIYPFTMGELAEGTIVNKNNVATTSNGAWTFKLVNTRGIQFEKSYSTTVLRRTSGNSVFTLNNWSHALVTWDGTNDSAGVHIYINGVEVSYTINQNGVGNQISDSANFLSIDDGAGSREFNGSIDDVLIFKRVLDSNEVKALYNASVNQYYRNFTGLSSGQYNFTAYSVDTSSNRNATANRTVTISAGDTTNPLVIVNLPLNTTYTTIPVPFNVTLNENGVCNYTLNSGVLNYTMQNNGNVDFNATNSSIVDGSYTVRYYCQDTAGNSNNTETRVFAVNNAQVSSCAVLSVAGTTYTQSASIVPSGASACINITAPNITYNCAGYTIINTTFDYVGIYSNVPNTFIKDCNVTLSSSSGRGIKIERTTNVNITNTTLNSNFYGLHLSSVNTSLIENVTASSNDYGIHLSDSSYYNIIRGIVTNSNTQYGVILIGSDYNNVTNITANSNSGDGVTFTTGADNNILTNAVLSGNGDAIHIDASANNLISLVTGTGSTEESVEIIGTTSTGNTFVNSSFSGATTDLLFSTASINGTRINNTYIEDYSFTDIGGLVIFANTSNGEIKFLREINGSGTVLSNDVIVRSNFVSISPANYGLNKSANITLYGMPGNFASPSVLRNGIVCTTCYNFTSLNAGTVAFNVSMNGNYTIGETPDTLGPVVTINLPSNTTYHLNNFSILFNVTLNENGTVLYSLDNGLNNVTMQNNGNRDFNATNSSMSDGSYVFRTYANDTAGNRNDSSSLTFSVNNSLVSACTTLSSTGRTYYLQNNVTSSGTCFQVTADGITLNANGYNITGSGAMGINAVGRTNFTFINGKISGFAVSINGSGNAESNGANIYVVSSTVDSIITRGGSATGEANGGLGGQIRLVNSSVVTSIISAGGSAQIAGGGVQGRGGTIYFEAISLNVSDVLINQSNGGTGSATGTTPSLTFNYTNGFEHLRTSYSSASVNFVVVNRSSTEVKWLTALTLNGQINLSSNLRLSTNNTFVNGSAISALNIRANITLYSMAGGFTTPGIFKDGSFCTTCYNFTSLNAGTVAFNTTGFSAVGTHYISERDVVSPTIDFVSPTETAGAYVNRNYVLVNVSASDSNLANITTKMFNSTGQVNSSNISTSPLYTNFSGLSDGVYYYNATAVDSFNNANSTETRNITIDTIRPLISYTSSTDVNNSILMNSIYVNVNISDINFANVTYHIWNTTASVNSTNFNYNEFSGLEDGGDARSVYVMNFTGLSDGTYYVQANTTDFANNKNSTEIRTYTILSSCLNTTINTCSEGSSCTITKSCILNNNICTGSQCDFTNFTSNATVRTLYNSSGDSYSLTLNISGNVSFTRGASFIFWGNNGTVGGDAGVLNITTSGLLNRTWSNFIGTGGYSTASSTSGGDGGLLYLTYHGLIGSVTPFNRNVTLVGGSSTSAVNGTNGTISYRKDSVCPLDSDLTNNGIIDISDVSSVRNRYANVSTDTTYNSSFDISCDNKLDVIDISKIGFVYERA